MAVERLHLWLSSTSGGQRTKQVRLAWLYSFVLEVCLRGLLGLRHTHMPFIRCNRPPHRLKEVD